MNESIKAAAGTFQALVEVADKAKELLYQLHRLQPVALAAARGAITTSDAEDIWQARDFLADALRDAGYQSRAWIRSCGNCVHHASAEEVCLHPEMVEDHDRGDGGDVRAVLVHPSRPAFYPPCRYFKDVAALDPGEHTPESAERTQAQADDRAEEGR